VINLQKTVHFESKDGRPIIQFICNGRLYNALIDTGATLPVFVKSADMLKNLGGRIHSKFGFRKFKFSGFGGEVSGLCYQLTIQVGDYHYIDMPVINVVDGEEPEYDIILPATAFSCFDYEICNSNNKIILKPHNPLQLTYNITLKDKDGKLFVLSCSVSKDVGNHANIEDDDLSSYNFDSFRI